MSRLNHLTDAMVYAMHQRLKPMKDETFLVTREQLEDFPNWLINNLKCVYIDAARDIYEVTPKTGKALDELKHELLGGRSVRTFKTVRCTSELFYKTSDGTYTKLQCSKSVHSSGAHATFGPEHVRVSWTDQDAQDSAKAASTAQKRTVPFVGWRCWKICTDLSNEWGHHPVQHQYKLHSMSARYVWEGPVATTRNRERLEKNNLLHGVYSYKTPNLMLKYLGLLDHVAGRMDLTGHVIEHEYGFRSQIATIRELWLFDDTWSAKQLERDIKPQFEDLYQCPVHVVRDSHRQLKAWAEFMTQEHRENGQ